MGIYFGFSGGGPFRWWIGNRSAGVRFRARRRRRRY